MAYVYVSMDTTLAFCSAFSGAESLSQYKLHFESPMGKIKYMIFLIHSKRFFFLDSIVPHHKLQSFEVQLTQTWEG